MYASVSLYVREREHTGGKNDNKEQLERAGMSQNVTTVLPFHIHERWSKCHGLLKYAIITFSMDMC